MNRARTVTMPVASLVEDLALYPRHALDEANVARLASALRVGALLPPVVVDRASKRIVDGWHRCRATVRVLGADAVIDVDQRDYATPQDMFLDAVRLNAIHGRPFDKIDRVRVSVQAQALGASDEDVAAALSIDEQQLAKLRVRVAILENEDDPRGIPGTTQIVLKRPAAHLEGQRLTQKQVDALGRAPGTSYLLLANQLNEGITEGLLDQSDERVVEALKNLYGTLQRLFVEA